MFSFSFETTFLNLKKNEKPIDYPYLNQILFTNTKNRKKTFKFSKDPSKDYTSQSPKLIFNLWIQFTPIQIEENGLKVSKIRHPFFIINISKLPDFIYLTCLHYWLIQIYTTKSSNLFIYDKLFTSTPTLLL